MRFSFNFQMLFNPLFLDKHHLISDERFSWFFLLPWGWEIHRFLSQFKYSESLNLSDKTRLSWSNSRLHAFAPNLFPTVHHVQLLFQLHQTPPHPPSRTLNPSTYFLWLPVMLFSILCAGYWAHLYLSITLLYGNTEEGAFLYLLDWGLCKKHLT